MARLSATVTSKQLIYDDLRAFYQIINKHEGKKVFVEIKRPVKSRSNNQNAYLWGVVYQIIGDELGYTTDEVHDAMKFKFLHKIGKIVTARSTTDLSTIEFETYCSDVRRFASTELGIFVPLPHETEYDYHEAKGAATAQGRRRTRCHDSGLPA